MSQRLHNAGLRCIDDDRKAVASCAECKWRVVYAQGATSSAFRDARAHAILTGHVAEVCLTHRTAYERIPDIDQ